MDSQDALSAAQALSLYREIHRRSPDNVECLRYLCAMCKELNEPDV